MPATPARRDAESKLSRSAVTIATLAYSGYLTERQNRLDFFVYQRVSESLAPFWDPELSRYFRGHHVGWICADLLRHRRTTDELSFMTHLFERKVPPADLFDARRRLRILVLRENYYWRDNRRLSMK